MESVTGAAILIDTRHADDPITGHHHPVVRDISITGLQVRNAPKTLEIRDAPHSPIHNLTLTTTQPPDAGQGG